MATDSFAVTGIFDFFITTSTTPTGSESSAADGGASFWVWLLSISLFLTAVVTFLGNGLVIVTFFADKRLLRSNFNVFLFNLTVTDFAVSITAIPLYAVDYLYGFWPFGDGLCHFWIFCDWGMTFASVYTLLAISVDRYWAVCWSHHYRAHNSRTTTFFIIAAVWCLVLVLWLPPYVNDRVIASNVTVSGCLWSANRANNANFAIFMAVAGYHLPSFIIVYCYIRVFVKMKKSSRVLTKPKQSAARTPNPTRPAEMRSTLTISSFRSTDSETGSNVRPEADFPRVHFVHRWRETDSTEVDEESDMKSCEVRIVITKSDEAKRNSRPISGAPSEAIAKQERATASGNSNQNLLRLPLGFDRQEMMKSNMSLDLPTAVDAVRTRELRRPCSFTEGSSLSARAYRKHSPDGAKYHWRHISGSVRSSKTKHDSAISQATTGSRETVKSSSSRRNREYKLFIRVTYIVVAYIVCWTPFHVVFDCQLAGMDIDTNLYTSAVLMCYLNSTLNPILYALGNHKLKAALMDTLACKTRVDAKSKQRH